jgi:hypothetical protein
MRNDEQFFDFDLDLPGNPRTLFMRSQLRGSTHRARQPAAKEKRNTY